jgi:AcrR family transcriptional regulator
MSGTELESRVIQSRPKRADARRNYDKLIEAAREAFTERDTSASLEDIARRAGVGIGTLYRHFPTRQALLEAVYVDEVEALSRSAAELADRPPWDALVEWLRAFTRYAATKRAISEELLAHMSPEATVFQTCRVAIMQAGQPLLRRAQAAGVVRPDAQIMDVIRMMGSIAVIPNADPEQLRRIFDIALDGLRAHPAERD